MKKLLFAAVATAALMSAGSAHAACGDVSLGAFSWQSSDAMANVDQVILSAGYGCNASIIAGDTVPTITSMIEKGQPDIASEATPSLLGDVYTKGAAEGRISQVGTAISDGQVSGGTSRSISPTRIRTSSRSRTPSSIPNSSRLRTTSRRAA